MVLDDWVANRTSESTISRDDVDFLERNVSGRTSWSDEPGVGSRSKDSELVVMDQLIVVPARVSDEHLGDGNVAELEVECNAKCENARCMQDVNYCVNLGGEYTA